MTKGPSALIYESIFDLLTEIFLGFVQHLNLATIVRELQGRSFSCLAIFVKCTQGGLDEASLILQSRGRIKISYSDGSGRKRSRVITRALQFLQIAAAMLAPGYIRRPPEGH